MRRSLALLALVLAGCGGSRSLEREGVPAFFVAAKTSLGDQTIAGTFDANGDPVAVVCDSRTHGVRIVTPTGERTVSLPGMTITRGQGLEHGYMLLLGYAPADGTGTALLDTATGTFVTEGIDPYGLFDGGREVSSNASGDFVVDLLTGVKTRLLTPEGRSVVDFKGNLVLLAKDEGGIPGTEPIDMGPQAIKRGVGYPTSGDNLVHRFSFSLQTVAGTALVDYAVPAGMTYVGIAAINESGEAVGFAYPALSLANPSLVRWDRGGHPTILATKNSYGDGVSIASDGRVIVHDDRTGDLLIYDGVAERKSKLAIGGSDALELSKDGRKAIDNGYNPGKVRFFRVP